MPALPYRDTALSIDERVDDLLSRMTVEEKAGQLTQHFHVGRATLDRLRDVGDLPADIARIVERALGVEESFTTGATGSIVCITSISDGNRVQALAAQSRLGIPLIVSADVIHGLRTIFPVPIAMAASWDPALIESAQSVAAREARAVGIHWALGPMVDIARDGRWGRIVEGAGEDPYLGAAVAAAQVRGFQGPHLGAPDRVAAAPKHFAGYGAAVGGRDYDEVEVSDSELHNVYLPPFRAAIEAGAATVMSAYMDLNGVPATGNAWLLGEVLRDELGFDGFVVSDADAVRSLVKQHFAADRLDAASRALTAGTDMEMCTDDPAFTLLPEAVARGRVDESRLDDSVRRVLEVKLRLGLFEDPFVDDDRVADVLDAPEHRVEARVAAERSAVLLTNDGILPLAATVGSVAVIGSLATSARDTLGPWSTFFDLDETVTVLDGVTQRAGDRVRVVHAPGVHLPPRTFRSPFDIPGLTGPEGPVDSDDDAAIAHAVDVATDADVAVVVVGQSHQMIGEAASVSTLDLPGRQLELVQAVAATGTPVVLVVMSGRPVDLRWPAENVSAILQAWYPGTQGGAAVASLLFGDVSPGGRLPFSWPRTSGQLPLYYGHLTTHQAERQGQRYWDEASTPLFPFGHGLSYASFTYGVPTVERPSIEIGESTTASVEVTNTTDRDADEVAQLYIHQRHGSASRPVRELKGFARVAVPAGATVTVTFRLGPDELRHWSAAHRAWVQDATTLDLWVGGDVTAEQSTTLEVRARSTDH